MIYIVIILLCRIVQALFSKRSSTEVTNMHMLIGYSAFKHTISAVLGLLLLLGSKGIHLDTATILLSFLSGVALFASGCCSIYAMKSGTVSLSSMFGTAGMLIPIAAGIFFMNQPVATMQLVGLGLFFIASFLLIGGSKIVYSNFSYKTLLLLIGSMVSNGCTMLAQQLFTRLVPDGNISLFSFLSFGFVSVFSALLYITIPRPAQTSQKGLSRSLIYCGVALAFCVFVINQLATLSTKLFSPIILFTIINGGATIISTIVAATVYKEKLNIKTTLGVILGIFSLILIKFFE